MSLAALARLCPAKNREDLEALALTLKTRKTRSIDLDATAFETVVARAHEEHLRRQGNLRLRDDVVIPWGAEASRVRKNLIPRLEKFIAFCEKHDGPRIPAQAYRLLADGTYAKVGPPSPIPPSPGDHARALLRALTAPPLEGGDSYWFAPSTHRKRTRGPYPKAWLDRYRQELQELGLKAAEARELLRLTLAG